MKIVFFLSAFPLLCGCIASGSRLSEYERAIPALLHEAGIIDEASKCTVVASMAPVSFDERSGGDAEILRKNSVLDDFNDATQAKLSVGALRREFSKFLQARGLADDTASVPVFARPCAIKTSLKGETYYFAAQSNSVAIYGLAGAVLELRWSRNVRYDTLLKEYRDVTPSLRGFPPSKGDVSRDLPLLAKNAEAGALALFPHPVDEIRFAVLANERVCLYSFDGRSGRLCCARRTTEDFMLRDYASGKPVVDGLVASRAPTGAAGGKIEAILACNPISSFLVFDLEKKYVLYEIDNAHDLLSLKSVVAKPAKAP